MNSSTSPISISVNVDSLAEAYGFPVGFQDKTFSVVTDRLLELSNRFNMRLTFFVVGKDLNDSRNRKMILNWSKLGHEIGNHSYSHRFDFARLPLAEIKDEITLTHKLISDVIGKEPKGFIAPVWSGSRDIWDCLLDLNYEYDTSVFPSYFLYPMIFNISWNHRKVLSKANGAFHRKDFSWPLVGNRKSFLYPSRGKEFNVKNHLVVMPLPTSQRLKPPVWHTLNFIFPKNFVSQELKSLLRSNPSMYYLIHPADFMDSNDLNLEYAHNLPRMNVPLSSKLSLLEEMFTVLSDSGRPVKTMLDHSRFLRKSLSQLKI